MAITKDICVLDVREVVGGLCSLRFCIWLTATNPYPNPNAVSAYSNINTDTNTTGILQAMQLGTIVEEVYTILVPTNSITNATKWGSIAEQNMLDILTARQKYKAGTAPASPNIGAKFSILHDSATGWSA